MCLVSCVCLMVIDPLLPAFPEAQRSISIIYPPRAAHLSRFRHSHGGTGCGVGFHPDCARHCARGRLYTTSRHPTQTNEATKNPL